MAIVQSMWLKSTKKRLGGTVIYQAMGQTRQRELAAEVSNPRTEAQMNHRVKWSALVNFYRANSSWMKYAYETKKQSQSEYNKFMSLNLTNSNIYFTKQEAAAGASLVMPYIMTQGSLPSVEFTEENGSWPSNIYYPAGQSLLPTTTIAQFSQALIQQNPALHNLDQISFIRFTQMTNAGTGMPYVIVRRYEVVLNTSSTELVSSYLPLGYIGVVLTGQLPQLAVIDSGLAGGFLMCISRTVGGKTYVSSQRIITTRMDSLISAYSSQAQLEAAVASYGQTSDAFLSSTSAEINSQAPAPLAIISIETDGVTYTPGFSVRLKDHFEAGGEIDITFNNDLGDENPTFGAVVTNKASHGLSSFSASGATVTATLPTPMTIADDEYLSYVSLRLTSGFYLLQFPQPSNTGGGGME